MDNEKFRGTTILMVRRGDKVAVAGDGQVTLGDMVMKHHAKKVRKLYHGKIIVPNMSAESFTFSPLFVPSFL